MHKSQRHDGYTYRCQKIVDQLRGIRNQIFKVLVDGIDGENGILSNI